MFATRRKHIRMRRPAVSLSVYEPVYPAGSSPRNRCRVCQRMVLWLRYARERRQSNGALPVIIHSPDGTHITASNQYWLDAAVERFIKASRESDGHREAPFGLSTSFDLAR